MYCRFCGKEVKEKAIVCTGCGRPVDTPGSVTTGEHVGWSISTMLAMVLATVFFPPVGLVFGFKGMLDEGTKTKASVLLTIAVFMTLMWAALILGL